MPPPPHPSEPGAGSTSERPRRGRPPGSVSLTAEVARRIVEYTRAGAFAEVAAQAAGISPRTLRDWLARGEGTHPSRSRTPKLRRFAAQVRQAQAEARLAAEVRVYREQPRYWLSRAARGTPESPGWTDPGRTPEQAGPGDTLEDRLADYEARMAEEAEEAARAAVFECEVPDCTCAYHRRRYDDELSRRPRAPSD